jgi:predicted acetyltransferase
VEIVVPGVEHVASYLRALESGWTFDAFFTGGVENAFYLARNAPDLLVQTLNGSASRTVTLPSGDPVPRLPSVMRWMWDGEFAGSINVRWQNGTTELPAYVLGHIGYGVVTGREGRGYATTALSEMLPLAWGAGLPFVELTTTLDNLASQKVIINNGGVVVEEFTAPLEQGSHQMFRWRIDRAN